MQKIARVCYLDDSDTLIVADEGYDMRHINRVFICKNYMAGNRETVSFVPAAGKEAECVAAAGDYVFTGGWKERGRIGVNRLSDGSAAGDFDPGETVGGNENTGWIDILTGITAHRRKDGEYLVFVEEDYKAKLLMYRWNPGIEMKSWNSNKRARIGALFLWMLTTGSRGQSADWQNVIWREPQVRYLLADMTGSGKTDLYRKYAREEHDPDSREAIRLWDAGVRVVNMADFERKWVTNQFGKDGRVFRVVQRGSDRTITGNEVVLSNDGDYAQGTNAFGAPGFDAGNFSRKTFFRSREGPSHSRSAASLRARRSRSQCASFRAWPERICDERGGPCAGPGVYQA